MNHGHIGRRLRYEHFPALEKDLRAMRESLACHG
jgi:hypothetical protein